MSKKLLIVKIPLDENNLPTMNKHVLSMFRDRILSRLPESYDLVYAPFDNIHLVSEDSCEELEDVKFITHEELEKFLNN